MKYYLTISIKRLEILGSKVMMKTTFSNSNEILREPIILFKNKFKFSPKHGNPWTKST